VPQRGEQVAGLHGRARLHLGADYLAPQRRERSLAIVIEQRFDQPSARQPRAIRQSLFADREITQPAVALLVERPVPAQRSRNRRRVRERLTLLAALLLGANPVGGVAELADLFDDRGIDRLLEFFGAELLADTGLRKLVAQLYIPTQLLCRPGETGPVAIA